MSWRTTFVSSRLLVPAGLGLLALSLVCGALLFAPLTSMAYDPPPDWANVDWNPISCEGVGDPLGEPGIGKDAFDLVCGTADAISAFYYWDEDFLYLRERVDGRPSKTKSGAGAEEFGEYAWVVLITLPGETPDYFQYLLNVNGMDDTVEIWENTTVEAPIYEWRDEADTLLWSEPTGNVWSGYTNGLARYLVAGTSCGGNDDYFVDWAIPISALISTGVIDDLADLDGFSDEAFFFATSADQNNYNKDYLDCRIPQAQLVVDKAVDPVLIPEGVTTPLTYTIGVTNISDFGARMVNVIDDSSFPSWIVCGPPSVTFGDPANSGIYTNTVNSPWDPIDVLVDPLVPGDTVTITLACDATPPPGSATAPNVTFTNTACASAANAPDVVCDPADLTVEPAPGTLTLVKTVTNDNGGTAVASDFQAYIDTTPVDWDTAYTYDPGTSLTASEDLVTGYSASVWSGDCASGGTVTIEAGVDKTCYITNNDQQAYITVVKVVNNDHGGSAQPNDFLLTLEGSPVTSGVAVAVDPGTYTADETLLPGYTFNGFSGDCDTNGDVTVALGESKTCTLTNTDQSAYITVVKVVNNDHGGSAQPNDFLLTLEGSPVTSGVAVAVDPGTYTADETLLPGYTFNGFSGDCGTNGDVTVALGESKTCTLTNTDQPAYITVVKVVNNDHGGSAQPNDFLLTLEGSPVTSGVAVAVDPGTYTAGETLLPGYTFNGFSGDCDTNGDVTVALGESKTCTLTNTDQPAYLTVIKHVVNDDGGTALAGDFTMTINGVTVPAGASFAGAESPGVTRQVYPGAYNVTESGPAPYAASYSADCTGSIALGESKSCTVTNDDSEISIDIEKSTNGQDADAPIGPYVHKGDPINWTYKVTNTGNVTLSNVAVIDTKGVTVSCPKTTLLAGQMMTCTASGTAIEGQYVNQGTAEGYFGGIKVSDVDLSHYFGIDPCIGLVKLGPTSTKIGNRITYVFKVTNCSAATPLDNVKLSDPRFPAMGVVSMGHLDPGQTKQHIYVYTVKESDGTEIINVATATGEDPLDKVVDDTDDWIVPITPEQPPEEFVPEWGSLALLASALAPLAGYARMRRRKK